MPAKHMGLINHSKGFPNENRFFRARVGAHFYALAASLPAPNVDPVRLALLTLHTKKSEKARACFMLMLTSSRIKSNFFFLNDCPGQPQ